MHNSEYSTRERFLAVVSGVIRLFCGKCCIRVRAVIPARLNDEGPHQSIAAAFITESFILLGTLAYMLTRWGVSKLHWGWFVFLSLLGSMAFALPIALLWPWRTHTT